IATTIDNTYGLLYIAVVVSSFWMYIRKYHSSDSIVVKSLVIAVLICDTIQQALLCHSVKSITDPAILPSVVNTLMIELFFSCAITTLVQQFYCWRIYKSMYSDQITEPVRLIHFCIYSTNAVKLSLLSDVISLQKLSIASNTLSAVADITISVVLVVILHGAKTGFKQSTDLVNRLMVFTFNTGLPTSVCALVATICVRLPSFLMCLQVGRLYTNSILVTLNSREYIKSSSEGASQEQYSLENSRSGRARIPQMPTRDGITIRIDTNTMHDLDNGSAQDLKN
ncbi:hypothetical protein B0H14DRAFT_2689745, partial [Mycena olivaceomarginata]